MSTQIREPEAETFVESALKLGGKSEEEARTTGKVDRADDQVDALFAARYQTANSPAHRVVWDREAPIDQFLPNPPKTSPASDAIMERSLEAVRRNRAQGNLLGPDGKVSDAVINDLCKAGYWGLLIDPEYGGGGASFGSFTRFLTKMATIEPNLAGMASVHGCIGAVDPLRTFGSPQQKRKYLPKLASGERLSAFALTEPGAGSDLTALKTEAVLDGDDYVVNGEKLFITNVVPGRTIGLVCLIEKRPAVLIVDLPDQENENFQLVRYGLLALRHLNNFGMKFKDLRVPRENLLQAGHHGDGLTIAYHGLNLGRVSLCATASGSMRVMLANMLPWAKFRRTYAAPIVTRELVKRRIGRMAALIVGCDALVDWCSWLLDQGYRGELECIIAKIFGSEAQKEAGIELFMKTHGGARLPKGPPVRRQHSRVSSALHLRRRGRDARHGVLQVADQGIWQAILRADRKSHPGFGDQEAKSDESGSFLGDALGASPVCQVASRPDGDTKHPTQPERHRAETWRRMPHSRSRSWRQAA